MTDTKQKFVNIYDEFRTLELSKEYYAQRISKARRNLRWMDIFLAFFAGGSGVLGFALWKQELFGVPVGPLLLSLATGVAVVLGIARPYLKLEDELERLSSIQGVYSSIAFAMGDLVTTIKTQQSVDSTSETVYKVLRQVRSTLGSKEDTPADLKLIDSVTALVNERYPHETYFYYPSEKVSDAM